MTDRPVADGIVGHAPDGATRVRFARRLPHPVDRVWAALTDPAELRRWWGDAELDLVDGGRFALRWRNTDDDGNTATLDGAIRKVDPPRFLEISAAWGSTGSADPGATTTLAWELEPQGDHTLLRFITTISAPASASADAISAPADAAPADAAPADAGAAPAEDTLTAAGWHLHLDALATVLSGGEVDIAHPEALFEPIHRAYVERYGSREE
jgi:uncharacterized protein YndB with AHSA1/START domain